MILQIQDKRSAPRCHRFRNILQQSNCHRLFCLCCRCQSILQSSIRLTSNHCHSIAPASAFQHCQSINGEMFRLKRDLAGCLFFRKFFCCNFRHLLGILIQMQNRYSVCLRTFLFNRCAIKSDRHSSLLPGTVDLIAVHQGNVIGNDILYLNLIQIHSIHLTGADACFHRLSHCFRSYLFHQQLSRCRNL